ncbi:MAG TPA: DUF3467 domain-containing protein [Anaerolineales bacterium]|nr:DUF3467 domain-containing protein [Anaerolineales bacterium]HRF49781.1 DUF3467 domain-containing protein [Anaerolineales bacterium]
MTEPAPKPQIQIELPAGLEPIYANFALVVHSPSEVIIDFARVMPNVPHGRVQTRVLMTPINAKLFLRALADNLARFEAQYGEITIPSGLADQLFRGGGKDGA